MIEQSVVLDQQLKDVLAAFAATMLTEFRLDAILDSFVREIVQLLPVTAAGVTLISPSLEAQRAAASDDDALQFELLQTELGEGPCVEAYRDGLPANIPELAATPLFPRFAARAFEAGLRAVFSFPMHHGDRRIGALDLYRDQPGGLTSQAIAAAQTLADVAAAYLINAQVRADLEMAAQQSQQAALHDPLTGLPNRILLVDRLEHALTRARRSGLTTALIYLDVNGFKAINDVYGHASGDQLLSAIAHRLRAVVRPSDTVARLHGDEFAVLCEDLDGPQQSSRVADRLHTAFAEPFKLAAGRIICTASIGVAYDDLGGAGAEEIVHQADLAMYHAKRNRSGSAVFTPNLQSDADERSALIMDLRHAQARNELSAAYQPIVELSTGRVTGHEALLRWTQPGRGPVAATTAVALAEESGLITNIGSWVMRRALRDRELLAAGGAAASMAVNVSPGQLMDTGFLPSVAEALQDTPAQALHMEITESVLLVDQERARQVMTQLKDMGVMLSLDDFGTGYSSLVYLKRFPFDIIKIDQTFIHDLIGNPASHTIVSSIIDLVHALNMTVIAEGVETTTQRHELAALGCDAAQGYLFAPPRAFHDLDPIQRRQ